MRNDDNSSLFGESIQKSNDDKQYSVFIKAPTYPIKLSPEISPKSIFPEINLKYSYYFGYIFVVTTTFKNKIKQYYNVSYSLTPYVVGLKPNNGLESITKYTYFGPDEKSSVLGTLNIVPTIFPPHHVEVLHTTNHDLKNIEQEIIEWKSSIIYLMNG